MSDSTPLPWALHSKASFARIVRADSAGRGGGVAQFVYAADAELACRAVNALGPLVAALEGLRYRGEPERFCDHAAAPCSRCDCVAEALRLAGKP